MGAPEDSFFSRWSRRKEAVREGKPLPPEPEPSAVPVAPAPSAADLTDAEAPPAGEQPALTLDDVARLTRESDYTAFVARGVQPEVKNAALKKLFTDPHFNVMDGLDTYIEDYGKPDPLPPGMLRQMVQSRMLGLFDDEPDDPAPPAAAPTAPDPAQAATEPALPHEDADLQLQPDPAAERTGAEAGAVEDDGRRPAGEH
jgi:hypothetical protein